MKLLKTKSILLLSFLSILLLSCKDDEKESTAASNKLNFEGSTYTFQGGVISDYGSADLLNSGSPTHYNFDFIIADDDFVLGADQEYSPLNATIGLYIELFSASTSSFQAGTFQYVDGDNATVADIEGKNVFGVCDLFFVDSADEYTATAGSVVVTKNSDLNYTLKYDLMVQKNGAGTEIPLKLAFTGAFKYDDERE